jgi:predicted transcriptional regulator of viral defense system
MTRLVERIQDRLWEVAVDQHGYVTSDDARELGINVVELGKLSSRGQIERVGYGIYRFDKLPVTPFDAYVLAVLWAGGRGVLSHETAIDLYEFADVNPERIHLTVPVGYRPRRQGGDLYAVHHQNLEQAQVRRHEGITMVKPVVAIDQVIDSHLASYLVRQAIDIAHARGRISEADGIRLEAKLEARR